jgi:hypothetical protein
MSRVVGSLGAKGLAWALALYLVFVTLGPQSVRPHVGPADAERFAAFFVTAVAFVVSYPRRPMLIAAGSAIFAVALELAQFLAPGRDPGVRDAIAKIGRRSLRSGDSVPRAYATSLVQVTIAMLHGLPPSPRRS